MAAETVEGGAELRAVALRLKAAGDVELWKALQKTIRVATAPARPMIRSEARNTLPRKGGLNQWVAKSAVRTSVLYGRHTAGVKVTVSKRGHSARDIDRGRARHPLFGDRDHWYTTQVRAGFASRPLNALKPAVAAACMVAMRETAAAAGFH